MGDAGVKSWCLSDVSDFLALEELRLFRSVNLSQDITEIAGAEGRCRSHCTLTEPVRAINNVKEQLQAELFLDMPWEQPRRLEQSPRNQ